MRVPLLRDARAVAAAVYPRACVWSTQGLTPVSFPCGGGRRRVGVARSSCAFRWSGSSRASTGARGTRPLACPRTALSRVDHPTQVVEKGKGNTPRGVRSVSASLRRTDEGMVKRIRGVAFSAKVSPQSANRMVDAARGVLNKRVAPSVVPQPRNTSAAALFCLDVPSSGLQCVDGAERGELSVLSASASFSQVPGGCVHFHGPPLGQDVRVVARVRPLSRGAQPHAACIASATSQRSGWMCQSEGRKRTCVGD